MASAASRVIEEYAPIGTRLLFANSFLATIPLGYLLVVLPVYLDRAGVAPATIGLLYTASGAVAAVLVALSGILADRWGRRRFLLAGTLLPLPSYLVFAMTTDVRWLVVASLFGGVGLANGAAGALTVAGFDAMLAEKAGDARRTRVFALSQALWSLALAIGSFCAAAPELSRRLFPGLGYLDAYRPPYLAMIVLTVLAALCVIPIADDPLIHAARVASGWLPRRSLRPIAVYSIGIGFLGFGLGIGVQLLPLWYALRFGVTEADLGPWYAAAQLLSLASVAAIPFLERTFGGPRTMFAALAGSGALLALIVAAPVFALAAALHVVRSFLTNLAWPFQQSLLMTSTAPEERASAVGIGFSVWGLTNAAGPLAAGALLGAGIFALPLLAGAAMYLCGGLAFGLGFARLAGPQRPVGS